jgi:gamma-glutamylcysteine synthetase
MATKKKAAEKAASDWAAKWAARRAQSAAEISTIDAPSSLSEPARQRIARALSDLRQRVLNGEDITADIVVLDEYGMSGGVDPSSPYPGGDTWVLGVEIGELL